MTTTCSRGRRGTSFEIVNEIRKAREEMHAANACSTNLERVRSMTKTRKTTKTASRRAAREGLPARFRMRHTPHYVDELLGDAPPRTVREIPISEIESPSDDRAELDDLERSIRRLGVIEPLLVASRGRRGAFYRVIAGMRRLRAAQRVGLGTVPCLVHDVDEERLTDMRDAAMQRLAIPVPPPEPEP